MDVCYLYYNLVVLYMRVNHSKNQFENKKEINAKETMTCIHTKYLEQ